MQTTLLAIQYYRRLQHMAAGTRTPWTAGQRLAARCMRVALAQYCVLAPAGDQRQYDELGARLRDAFVELTIVDDDGDGDADDAGDEECNQCDATVGTGADACRDGHVVTRCCISALLAPLATAHGCRQCGRVALDDIEALRAAVREVDDGAVFRCPVCDVPLLRR